MKEKKKNKKNYIYNIIILISLCVLIFSGYKLYEAYSNYNKIDNDNDEIVEKYVSAESEELEKYYYKIHWEQLLKENEDIVGWIEIPNTKLNYVLLQGDNDDTYLRHDMYHEYTIAGSIFVANENKDLFNELNTIIYGHNMKNDSMFGTLKNYVKDSEYINEHPYINIYLTDGTMNKYEIISASYEDAYDETLYNPYVANLETYYKYILSNNKLSVEVDSYDKPLITLSTCATYDVEDPSRIVVHARLVENIEKPQETLR